MKNSSKTSSFYLQKGDIVDIVAPGSACPPEQLVAGVKWLEDQGFKARYDLDILKPDMYLSHSDEFRFKDLKKALFTKDSKAIWCLRGGYGSFRLWPELLKIKKAAPAKLFIGISDVTSLHQYLIQKWKWPVLYGSLLDRVGQGKLPPENEAELVDVITGQRQQMEFENLTALNQKAQKKSVINGKVLGGNLAVFTYSLGTALQPKIKTNEKVILFFEDIGERGYKVDRFLQQLKQANVFKNVQAIVFGEFIDGLEKDGKSLVPNTLSNFAKHCKVPVFSGLDTGHGTVQRPLFLNSKARLSCGENPNMIVYSPYET